MRPIRITEPLSPPSSPRMSSQDQKAKNPLWHSQQAQNTTPYAGGVGGPPPFAHSPQPFQTGGYPHYGEPPHQVDTSIVPRQSTEASLAELQQSRDVRTKLEYGEELATGSQPLPQSALAPMSPRSAEEKQRDALMEDEELDMESDDGHEDDSKVPMTAAELRNQKRKMKRFRLTHNQTRFLMSEFARQAHPDAAHRERLSREIPGLSPRQVQVWFQNRRAKLKRLTVEDRERMMRSRALPENFNMPTPAHAQYGPSSSREPQIEPNSGHHAALQRPGYIRPLTLDTLRRGALEHNYSSPTGASPALGSLAFTPPQSATDTTSPLSNSGDMAAFGFQRASMGSPRRPPFPGSGSSAPIFSSYYHPSPRMPAHERFRRASGDSVGSPLRTSISYGSFNPTQAHGTDARALHLNDEPSISNSQREGQREMRPPPGPYGLGFSYDPMTSYQGSMHGSQHASASPSTAPQHLQPHYRVGPPPAQHPPTGTFPHYLDYQSTGYSASHHYPSIGATFGGALHPNTYTPQPSIAQPTQAPVPSQSQQQYAQEQSAAPRTENQEVDEDHTEGVVPIPTY